MKVNVQTPHFVADQKLINFIQKKMDKLEKFYDHIIYADVFLKLAVIDRIKLSKFCSVFQVTS